MIHYSGRLAFRDSAVVVLRPSCHAWGQSEEIRANGDDPRHRFEQTIHICPLMSTRPKAFSLAISKIWPALPARNRATPSRCSSRVSPP